MQTFEWQRRRRDSCERIEDTAARHVVNFRRETIERRAVNYADAGNLP
jgi:hypothetical protein